MKGIIWMLLAACCAATAGAADAAGDNQPKEPVKRLAELIVSRNPKVTECEPSYGSPFPVGPFGIGCLNANNQDLVALRHADVVSPFTVLSVPSLTGTLYYLVYEPMVPRDAKDVEALKAAGAILSDDDVIAAVKLAVRLAAEKERARQYVAEQKAVAALQKKIAVGRPFDGEPGRP